jgi:glutathione S-transferase
MNDCGGLVRKMTMEKMMPEILLHQYASSPFAEKIRVCLGIKKLAWGAVDEPVIMPKPELTALTGGYRRIPVMQIGADIYCDSQLIVRELERRFPEPTLFPAGDSGLIQATALWTDRAVFQAAVAIIFGGLGDNVPSAFIKDREALSGGSFNPAAMSAAVPHMTGQLRAHVALLAEQLADGRAFLTGERPSLADANSYYNLWFIRSAYPPATKAFDQLPHIGDWLERVRAIGHGEQSEVSREAAIDIAHKSKPLTGTIATKDAKHAGKQVTVAADDYGRDAVTGLLVGSSEHHVAIQRNDPRAGQVVVHFPRIGFSVLS